MDPVIPKYFNVAGPCIPDRHYMLPAVARLPEARLLAERGQYFVLHAARQSGKTTLLRALTREINAAGRLYALYCSLETLQGYSDPEVAGKKILAQLRANLELSPERIGGGIRLESTEEDAMLALRLALSRLS
ncbi:MAG: hypothetical protein LBU64_07365, partial [Planctomycetota bacterium]|nr:hypothetical protein [Planctomycetota bacterium]